MRNSWESWDKSDSYLEEHIGGSHYVLGKADRKLALTLSKAGGDHAKYLRQISVEVDIIAPEYWWKEYDTYKVGTVANSTSMMHTLGKDYTPESAFNLEDVDDDLADRYMDLIHDAQTRWFASGKKKPSREWRQMVQLTAQSFIYTRTCTLNYQVLKSMYHSRKNHRLQEWRDFANWVETLPYQELITLKEDK
jgi:hypothetical protein